MFIGKLVTAMGSFVWPMRPQNGTATLLIVTDSNYRFLWTVFLICGLVAAALYGLMYKPDKRTFPKLYE